MIELSLSIRNVSPGPEAMRLTGLKRPGAFGHTGGAWLLPGEVWKPLGGIPLDGRSWEGVTVHHPTREAECLEAMAGEYLFPRNWRLEERNGRKFVVRKIAHLIPEDLPYTCISDSEFLQIKAAISNLNRKGWGAGDRLTIAKDPDTYELFFYDLSCATQHSITGDPVSDAHDDYRVYEFFEQAGQLK